MVAISYVSQGFKKNKTENALDSYEQYSNLLRCRNAGASAGDGYRAAANQQHGELNNALVWATCKPLQKSNCRGYLKFPGN